MTKETLCGFAVGDRVNWTALHCDYKNWQDVEVIELKPEGTENWLRVRNKNGVSGVIRCELAEHVRTEPTPKELADEYRKLIERETVVIAALKAAGFTIVRKYYNRADIVIKPDTVMAQLEEMTIEKIVTTTESL